MTGFGLPGPIYRGATNLSCCVNPGETASAQVELLKRWHQARLPWLKRLEQFDFSFQPSIDRKVARELSTLGFVGRADNVVLLGPPGVGKTHLAIRLAVKAAEEGHRILLFRLVARRYERASVT